MFRLTKDLYLSCYRHGSRPDWLFILFSAEIVLFTIMMSTFGVLVVLRFFHII